MHYSFSPIKRPILHKDHAMFIWPTNRRTDERRTIELAPSQGIRLYTPLINVTAAAFLET